MTIIAGWGEVHGPNIVGANPSQLLSREWQEQCGWLCFCPCGSNVPETGLAATGGVGSVSVVAEAIISPTTVVATGSVGSVVVAAAADVGVSGSAGTTAVGSVVP